MLLGLPHDQAAILELLMTAAAGDAAPGPGGSGSGGAGRRRERDAAARRAAVACAAAAALAGLDALAQRGRSARPGPARPWPPECPSAHIPAACGGAAADDMMMRTAAWRFRQRRETAHMRVQLRCPTATGLGLNPTSCTGEPGDRDDLAERARGLADAVLAEAAEQGDAALQRAAAEAYAAAACIGSDTFAVGLVRGVCRAAGETPSPARCATAGPPLCRRSTWGTLRVPCRLGKGLSPLGVWSFCWRCVRGGRRGSRAAPLRHRSQTGAGSKRRRSARKGPRPRRRGALALAAGAIFRAKGGIALAAAADGAAGTLLALAPSSPPGVHLWLLHGLWLLARAAGLGFMPHVRPALDLALAVLLAEGSATVPGLRPAAGRRVACSPCPPLNT